MKYDDIFMFVSVIIVLMIGLILGGFMGYDSGKTLLQREAVTNGHAEYYLDKDFNRQFRWKEAK